MLTRLEFLEDRLIAYYHLRTGYGHPDDYYKIVVAYNSIDKLPKVPERVGLGVTKSEDIFIPQCNRTITFIFDSYQENSMGPNEELVWGPYVKE